MGASMLWWGRVVLFGYADSLAGLAIAAAILNSVSLTRVGAVEAAAVLMVFGCTAVALLRRAVRFPDKLWPIPLSLFVAGPVLFLGGLVVAAVSVPGFDIRGFWA